MKTETAYVAEDGKRFECRWDCEKYERELEKKKEEELMKKVKKASDAFLLSVGFDTSQYETIREKNDALNLFWLVFDKQGKVYGLKSSGGGLLERHGIKCDFRYVSGDDEEDKEIMENWLRKNKLYGNRLHSFADRKNLEFYEWDLLTKLENLGWEVKNGELANTAW